MNLFNDWCARNVFFFHGSVGIFSLHELIFRHGRVVAKQLFTPFKIFLTETYFLVQITHLHKNHIFFCKNFSGFSIVCHQKINDRHLFKLTLKQIFFVRWKYFPNKTIQNNEEFTSICNIMAKGFRFMPLGLVRTRTFRLSTWFS